MWASGSPLAETCASAALRMIVPAGVCVAGATLIVVPDGPATPGLGEVVSYEEDRIGRPWRIVEEDEFGRYVIRNGRVFAVADPDEIGPYEGVSEEATPVMAGESHHDELATAMAGLRR